MAESSILIADQSGGRAVAMRLARELDENDNERHIQLMDVSGRVPVFSRTFSDAGLEFNEQILRGDQSKMVVSVKTTPVFTQIFVQIQFRGLYGVGSELMAVKQLSFAPSDLFTDTEGGAFLYSDPVIVDLSGASEVVVRAWGTGFPVETGMYVYSGLI